MERDTARNLRVFDFIKENAESEEDRYALEEYRPYVIMMNTRACALQLLEQSMGDAALERVEAGVERIKDFFNKVGHPRLALKCREYIILQDFADEIRENWKSNPIKILREKMQEAVDREDYESAAEIRDRIKRLQAKEE